VVAFWFPDDPSKSYVKRLVGMPGDTVQVRAGKTFVNGQELDEPYVDPKLNAVADVPPVYVKPHYYFVMGDNRNASSDSRSWGLVPEKYIYAKMIAR
jgi:signal peptidase I